MYRGKNKYNDGNTAFKLARADAGIFEKTSVDTLVADTFHHQDTNNHS